MKDIGDIDYLLEGLRYALWKLESEKASGMSESDLLELAEYLEVRSTEKSLMQGIPKKKERKMIRQEKIDKLLKLEYDICPICAKHTRTRATYSAKPNKIGVEKIVMHEIPYISRITALKDDEICTRCSNPQGALNRVIIWEISGTTND